RDGAHESNHPQSDKVQSACHSLAVPLPLLAHVSKPTPGRLCIYEAISVATEFRSVRVGPKKNTKSMSANAIHRSINDRMRIPLSLPSITEVTATAVMASTMMTCRAVVYS